MMRCMTKQWGLFSRSLKLEWKEETEKIANNNSQFDVKYNNNNTKLLKCSPLGKQEDDLQIFAAQIVYFDLFQFIQTINAYLIEKHSGDKKKG